MYEKEILIIQNKIAALKEIYENNRNKREILVKEMTMLDEQLERLEKTIEGLKLSINKKTPREKKLAKFQEQKRIIKEFITEDIIKISKKNPGRIIISLIQLIVVLFIYFFENVFNSLTEFKNKITKGGNPEDKKKEQAQKELIHIEKVYQKIKEKRITAGQKYRKVREREVSAYNVYKNVEYILKQIPLTQLKTPKTIDMKDIYYRVIMNPTYCHESIENQKKLLDDELSKYLCKKIGEINYSLFELGKLNKLTTKELVSILANYIPVSQHANTISHIIHTILTFVGNQQSYSIVWIEENDETLINFPTIIFDEQGRWNALKTHPKTDYVTIFEITYDTLMNEEMKKIEEYQKLNKNKKTRV